ncbi:hypothetical protein C9439_03325 [archaeon SCG-AAA382B04]|nr:hypothetical protein C9439_03325 [archaeon SCG-AAA382B04]
MALSLGFSDCVFQEGDNGDGNRGVSEVSSLDFKVTDYDLNGLIRTPFRLRANNIQSNKTNFRIDKLNSDEVMIYNGEEKKFYGYFNGS